MKVRYIIGLIISFAFNIQVACGQICFELCFGRNSYAMGDLKELSNLLKYEVPVQAKIMQQFPSTYDFGFNILYQYTKWRIGASYCHFSTGSHLSYEDYSGSLQVNQVISAHTIGVDAKYEFIGAKWFHMFLNVNPVLVNSEHTVSSYMKVFDSQNSEELKFVSTNGGINLKLEMAYAVRNIEIGVFAGYFFDFKGTLYFSSNEKIYLTVNNEKAYSDWSGSRLGITLCYKFRYK
jgi:hypothetical protein